MKVVMPYSASLTKQIVAIILPKETGSSPMELEYLVERIGHGTSSEPEVRWLYV